MLSPPANMPDEAIPVTFATLTRSVGDHAISSWSWNLKERASVCWYRREERKDRPECWKDRRLDNCVQTGQAEKTNPYVVEVGQTWLKRRHLNG